MTEESKITLYNAVEYVRQKISETPEVAIVLGSGLGAFANYCTDAERISYSVLNGFPTSSVKGHAGEFVFGKIEGKSVALMCGRVHMYEGYSAEETVFPIRLLGLLGVKKLVLTNAAGAVNNSFSVGDLMMITDHISTFVPSPLRGKNDDSLGERFPDMSSVYDFTLQEKLKAAADKANIMLREGIYMQLPGPQYETPAEIRMCRTLGADAVGMSTAVEAIAARHMGLMVCGISCITNMAAGITKNKLSHNEVQQTASVAFDSFSTLLYNFLKDS